MSVAGQSGAEAFVTSSAEAEPIRDLSFSGDSADARSADDTERKSADRHPIEDLPLNERAGAYEHELETLRSALDGTDTELDFGA